MSSEMSFYNHLPSRFPDGTRYVIEGRGGRIHLRYLQFPDGRTIALPAMERAATRHSARNDGSKSRPKKNSNRPGTPHRLAS